MKTWYHAVCRRCCESVCVMVSNPNCTGAYLGEHSGLIQEWLTRHGGCRLELIHSDQDLDVLFDDGWRPLRDFYPQGKDDTNWKLDREGIHLIVKPRDPDDLSVRSLRVQLALPEQERRRLTVCVSADEVRFVSRSDVFVTREDADKEADRRNAAK